MCGGAIACSLPSICFLFSYFSVFQRLKHNFATASQDSACVGDVNVKMDHSTAIRITSGPFQVLVSEAMPTFILSLLKTKSKANTPEFKYNSTWIEMAPSEICVGGWIFTLPLVALQSKCSQACQTCRLLISGVGYP